ncbi:AhpC-TSA-domain-containing protein [Trametes versicolor FP-101664 SS1]|uniref:AhpC-TSA-domain-containing protein n=1 Tax=Trametes versicolor (strain FP-101664) TaxID=717944 RepID=UPI0004621D52|nr:AhpC-TSA-domain-containing protein [Trametes versicolor FP-101664 SS1]EIW55678.1 AhpC-TSA-domain-containing protein [Trametes versicolor FP-101664 SS1]
MAPRAKASSETVEPARRSTRISAQPKVEAVKEIVKKAVTKATSKKRAADAEGANDGGDAAPTVKKSKAENPASEESGDALNDKAEAPALSSIDIGDSLPSYTLKSEKDEDVNVAALAAEKGVIFFLVPKADTPGCTTQACGFRDIYPDFTALGFDVYCLSADKPSAQAKWQTKKELPYPLLSDPKRVLITALGAGEGGKTKRSHFIFAKGGKLVDKKVPVKPADSPKLALEFVKLSAAET